MLQTLDALAGEAMKLPVRGRAALARLLIDSLPAKSGAFQPAWAAEVKRRLAAWECGEEQTIPASDVFEDARKMLSPRSGLRTRSRSSRARGKT